MSVSGAAQRTTRGRVATDQALLEEVEMRQEQGRLVLDPSALTAEVDVVAGEAQDLAEHRVGEQEQLREVDRSQVSPWEPETTAGQ